MRFLLVCLVGLVLACGDREMPEEAARAELESRGIEFTVWAFRDSAYAGNLAVVRLFVEAGISVDTVDAGGYTALHSAAFGGHLELVRYLVEEQGADVNVRDDDRGNMVLHAAARYGHLDIVRYLVEEQGADVNVRDKYGDTVLLLAAWGGWLEVVQFLVEQGMDVNVKNPRGKTPRDVAVYAGHPAVVNYFDSLADE